jgi:hypothetical protein
VFIADVNWKKTKPQFVKSHLKFVSLIFEHEIKNCYFNSLILNKLRTKVYSFEIWVNFAPRKAKQNNLLWLEKEKLFCLL